MKKILLLVLAVMLGLGIAVSAFAEATYTGGPDARVLTYAVGLTTTRALSTTIVAGNRILGFSYTDSAAGTGALFDASTVALVNGADSTYVIAECSVAAGTSQTVMFPFPRAVNNGLVTGMSTATGALVVYYQ